MLQAVYKVYPELEVVSRYFHFEKVWKVPCGVCLGTGLRLHDVSEIVLAGFRLLGGIDKEHFAQFGYLCPISSIRCTLSKLVSSHSIHRTHLSNVNDAQALQDGWIVQALMFKIKERNHRVC